MDVREKLMELLAPTSLNFEQAAYLADYLVNNGVTVQEWIPVKDRLPEDQEEVLVCTRSKNGVRNIDKGYMASTASYTEDAPKLPTGCHCRNRRKENDYEYIPSVCSLGQRKVQKVF